SGTTRAAAAPASLQLSKPRSRPLLLMSEPTPATPPTEEAKKRLREKVDKLLAQDPFKSEASIVLNGRTMKYSAVAAFVPVMAGGLDEKRDRKSTRLNSSHV